MIGKHYLKNVIPFSRYCSTISLGNCTVQKLESTPPFFEVLYNRFSRKLYNAKIGIHSSRFRGTEISTLPLIPFPFSLGGPSAEVLKSTGIPFRFFRSPVSPELLPFSRYGNCFGKNFRFFISLDFFLFFGLSEIVQCKN